MKLRLLGFFVCFYLLIASKEPPWADAHIMYETAVSLVERHSLAIDLGGPASFYSFHEGKKYGLYPIGNVVALVPSYLIGKLLSKIPHAPPPIAVYASHVTTSLLAAACCALFFGLARRAGASVRAALFLTFALGTQTILVIYARVCYSEALQSFLFVWLLTLGLQLGEDPTPGRSALAGFAAGWLVATKAVNVLAVGVLLLYVIWQNRRDRRRLLITIGCAAATFIPWSLLTLFLNRIKTGSYFDTGYSTAGGANFTGQFYDALHGFLLSPGKSIFFYSPIVILGVIGFPAYYRRNQAQALLVLGLVLAVLLPHLKFRNWYGGWVWGPRYTVPITALMLLPAATWIGPALARGRVRLRAAWLALLALVSAGVQVLGCVFYWDFYIRMAIAARGTNPADEPFTYVATVFMPQFSPIVMHAWLAWHKMLDPVHMPPDLPFQPIVGKLPNLANHYAGLSVDFWMVPFLAPGAPKNAALWAFTILALLMAGVVGFAVSIRSALRSHADGRS